MDTKSKNYKNLAVRLACFFGAVLFAALSLMQVLSAARTDLTFHSSNGKVTSTPAFIYAARNAANTVLSSVDYIDIFDTEISYDEFIKASPKAARIKKEYSELADYALKLFDTIELLKDRCPISKTEAQKRIDAILEDQDESSSEEYYYEGDDTPYYLDKYGREYRIGDNGEKIYSGSIQDATEVTEPVASAENTDRWQELYDERSEKLFEIRDEYSDFSSWSNDYFKLRGAVFSVVYDATSKDTIKTEIDSNCTDKLETLYWNNRAYSFDLDKMKNKFGFVFTDGDKTITNIDDEKLRNDLIGGKINDNDNFISIRYTDGELKGGALTAAPYGKIMNIVSLLDDSANIISLDASYFRHMRGNKDCDIYLLFDISSNNQFGVINDRFIHYQNKSFDSYIFAAVVFAVISSAFAVIFVILKTKGYESKKACLRLRLPFIIYFAFTVLFIGAVGADAFLSALMEFKQPLDTASTIITDIASPAFFISGALIGALVISFVSYITINKKAHTLHRRFLIGFIAEKIKKLHSLLKVSALDNKKERICNIILLGAYWILSTSAIILFSLFIDNTLSGIAAIFIFLLFFNVNTAVIVYCLINLIGYSRLASAANEMANGNYGIEIKPEKFFGSPKKAAGDLILLKSANQEAINKAIRDERTKTELITNVSHDLKTPLTSIINYVSLLKLCGIKGETENEYLDVLEEKSKKLQRLIEDLTEASKATTGNIRMNAETVELNELAMQAVGENSDIFEGAGLDLIVNEKCKNVYITADSLRLFRVIDNLFSNARKYSLPGTRVYVDISRDERYGIMKIKNISREQLNISPDDLMERFVRGDNSRSTDGSGLGLSIAKSFIELQNGIFDINISGDMFEAVLKLPAADKPAESSDPAPAAPDDKMTEPDVSENTDQV